ncbi:hypothetical protein [Paraburkholderia sp. CNPSo 3281]|uniref:hypothetical protein n=1 Tax=Paraburkholderia sp. CNPSo 3281 TaxID=2940933 RepID=UPI0020B8D6B5|nr:hypothetical protein [Paraburkholderia sp. CNPSo 3281]
MPPHEWTVESGRWQSVAAYCERHGRSDLAPALQTGEALPHPLDERDSVPVWVNRALRLFFEDCMSFAKASDGTVASNNSTAVSSASEAVAEGMRES